MNNENFYQNLKKFTSFTGITNSENFQKIPEDWKVIITDVKGSTKAIEEGRYKDINTIGAAAIIGAQKGMKDLEFPFVFGGDGATFIIPPHYENAVMDQLLGLKELSEKTFNLGLRLGIVDMGELYNEGGVIEVAKFELASDRCIAIFRGGGLTLAEDKIKGDEAKYCRESEEDKTVDLSGLSCRWNPIPNKNGTVLSLLVEARTAEDYPVYEEILAKINKIFKGKLRDANPINIDDASYKSIKECIETEKRYHDSIWSFQYFHRMFEIVMAVLIFKFKIPPLIFNPKKYANAMATHSDFRKFDDMLRMIIDCNKKQVSKIETLLEEYHNKGSIFYGLFQSENSLMTCYVDNLNDGGHIHFVDGDDGGYAIAAKQLKSQRSLAEQS